MSQRQNSAIARFTRSGQPELRAQMTPEASTGECADLASLQLAGEQLHETIHRRRMIAGRLAFHEFANHRGDLGLFGARKSQQWMHRCYNSQFQCLSWIFRQFATSCRIATRCSWWMPLSSSKKNALSASKTSR